MCLHYLEGPQRSPRESYVNVYTSTAPVNSMHNATLAPPVKPLIPHPAPPDHSTSTGDENPPACGTAGLEAGPSGTAVSPLNTVTVYSAVDAGRLLWPRCSTPAAFALVTVSAVIVVAAPTACLWLVWCTGFLRGCLWMTRQFRCVLCRCVRCSPGIHPRRLAMRAHLQR